LPEASPDPAPAAPGGGQPDSRAPAERLAVPERLGGFGLAPDGGRATVRRTWLDTFDWRLYRAGLTLEQVSRAGGGPAELRLTGRDGALIIAEPLPARRGGALPKWPQQIAGLPAGPLAEQLAGVIGVRALLPVARAVSVLRERRALNGDGKTVARLTVDDMSVIPVPGAAPEPPAGPAAPLPSRLAVRPVRGYQAQADRLAALLGGLPGAAAAGGPPPLEAALAAGGRRAGDYSGRIDVDLAEGMPARAAVAVVLTALLGTLEANVPGTIADTDTEFLHDLRVAVRRTRSALKLAGAALPAGARERFAPEFKWLGDLTTLTRDLDVYLLGLPAMTEGLVGAAPGDLGPFGEHLRRSRAAARRDLLRGLRSARFARLRHDWRQLLEAAAEHPRRKPPVQDLAAASIAAAHRRVLAGGAAITPDAPPERLHDLRKRCKELRYALEIFASLHAPDAQWRAVRELKGLQDCLGEYQDAEVQRAELRAFAAQMMAQQSAPAQTLLAMGEVAAGLARRERAARAEFDGLFRQFARPSGQARIRALTEQAGP
jgi:CHAD domain-containing protein